MIRCIIVDDEPLAQQVIERYVQQTTGLQLVKKCSNAIEAYNTLKQGLVDLMFLDIKMPVVSGIDFLKSFENPPSVIFTTAYSEYAIDGFELNAVDYLLKPVTYGRFKKAINKFLNQSGHTNETTKNYFYIKAEGKLVRVFHKDMFYAESMRDYMKIVTAKEKYITHLTMKSLVGLLPPQEFVQVHRSFIINTAFVTSISKKEVEISAYKIPVGSNFKEGIDKLIQRTR